MDEVLKFVTPDGVLKKKNFLRFFFAKIAQFQDFCRLFFGLEDLF